MVGIDVFWPRDRNCGKFTSWNLKDTAVRRTGRKHSRLSGLSWLMIAKALDQTKEHQGGNSLTKLLAPALKAEIAGKSN